MVKKLLLTFSVIFINTQTYSYPCTEILFEYVCNDPVDITYHDLSIQWKYNSQCEGHADRSNKFIIQIHNIYNEVILMDTVEGFSYTIKSENLDSNTAFYVFNLCEVGKEKKYNLGLRVKTFDQNIPDNLIERLNTFLLNGYFLNAMAILPHLRMPYLAPDISAQISMLFPANYTGNCDFFNAYLSNETNKLIPMPYVSGLDEFTKGLNKATKHDFIKEESFVIKLMVSPNNEVNSMTIERTNYESVIKELVSKLNFQNNHNAEAMVLIKLEKSNKGKKYIVTNKRALIDPDSKDFRKKYPYKGATN